MTTDIPIDIAIIGGGCAGLMSGCVAAAESQGKLNIVIFEKNNKTGRKLLATGNGRCNLSNTAVSFKQYNKSCQKQLKKIGELLSFEFTQKLFNEMGLLIKTDNSGRAYPKSGNASSVLDVLRNSLTQSCVEEHSGERIKSIIKAADKNFIITGTHGEYKAKNIILACGGCASPVFGSDGEGFALAKAFSHNIITPFPSLAPVPVKENIRELKGVRAECRITLTNNGEVMAEESGELQINEDNVSGICVFNLSEIVNRAFINRLKPPEILIDFLPDISIKDLQTFIIRNAFALPEISVENALSGIINKKLAAYIIKKSLNISPSLFCKKITKKELCIICESIKCFKLTPKKMSDFKKAQISNGGVCTDEVDFTTMSSMIVEGLYFAGEIMDVNAPCGGFNLQWAWTSAAIAAKSAVRRCEND